MGRRFPARPSGSRDQPDQDMPLTMAQGMKRLGTPIAALLGVALIALIATSWLINRDALRKAVETQIRDVTGLELNVAARSTFRCCRRATFPSMTSA